MLDLPLERIHKFAFKAAEATHCAEDQGKFWEMKKRLFENQRALEPWSAHAEALGLDVAAFDACMSNDAHAEEITFKSAVKSALGQKSQKGEMRVGYSASGAQRCAYSGF